MRIKSLRAVVGGCFGPDYTVDIDFDQLKIIYSQKVFLKEKRIWNTLVAEQSIESESKNRIIHILEKLNLIHWKTWYIPEEKIMDGTSWKVSIELDDFVKCSYGENDYPEEWGAFCEMIENVTGEKFR